MKEEQKTGVVYSVPRSICKKSYIGETGRTLEKRISEHKYAIQTGNLNNGLAKHYIETGHLPNWNSSSIIGYEDNIIKRKILESIKIKTSNNNLNLDEGLKISTIWNQHLP